MSAFAWIVSCSLNDGWSAGAYIRIVGPDGQLLYIGVMTEKSKESHDFSCFW